MHDLLAAKSIAGRDKDIDFLSEAAAHGLADVQELLARLDLTDASPDKIEPAKALVRRVFLHARNPTPGSTP